jgi:hypothetical protein
VQLADLIDWRSREKVKAKDADFGRWLFPQCNTAEVHKLIHAARKMLFEAVERAIPALAMQVDMERASAKSSKKLPPN